MPQYLKMIYLETGSLEFLYTKPQDPDRCTFFPDIHLQTITLWTKFKINLSNHFEKNHETMAKREKMYIVYYMSLKGVLNLSRKLTLRWTGPYWVISTPSETLSVIDPI